jgi:pimeloyl-ACP methyl ester carboxylesterase
MPYVATRAGRVFYEDRGAGRPVVMLHANLHDHRDFDAVAERLSSERRTIAIDWPSHGESDPVAPGQSLGGPLFAEALAEVLAEVAPEPAVLIGNSVGGYAAARLALDHPELVAGLVLVNSAGFIRPTPVTRLFCRVLGSPAVARRVLPRMVPRYMRPRNDADRAIAERVAARARTADGAQVAAAVWRSFNDPAYDLRSRAAAIRVPTLLVWGTRDVVLPAKAGRQTHAALPGADLETLPVGHVVFASDPEGFLALVEPFIARGGG